MKNVQYIILIALIVAVGALVFFKGKKKCSCGDHAEYIPSDETVKDAIAE